MMSLNVRGARDVGKFERIIKFVYSYHIDLLVLTETHITVEIETVISKKFPDLLVTSHAPHSDKTGVTFVSTNKNKVKWTNADIKYRDLDGRAMAIRMTCDGAAKPFVCLGIYAPNIPSPPHIQRHHSYHINQT